MTQKIKIEALTEQELENIGLPSHLRKNFLQIIDISLNTNDPPLIILYAHILTEEIINDLIEQNMPAGNLIVTNDRFSYHHKL